ncbi:GNAT family N-acetyltransferase [Chitinophaga rhizophila]|uniref:GNAT family N-acetyltransferase n=1 Tax=Chitinophaga rhizophila TaxID=2866212 RepID=A0ABS7G725_9BACT|nr:GNAT family N-acetyltransferase [Chitinophaga rhizophila]MBW8683457.1 GNAT family N-acetyltransferase [Chitinophaga rhizophila]
MLKATLEDKTTVLDILTKSFENNPSVNFIIKQDRSRIDRIRCLMEYSFHLCLQFGEVFLSDNKAGCALLLYSDKRRTSIKSIFWDLRLVLFSLGLGNIFKTQKREFAIKKHHPNYPFFYLWFIGVIPEFQGAGTGTKLLTEILQYAKSKDRDVYLETSLRENVSWYEKFGFTKYHELDFGYLLFLLKREWKYVSARN